MAVARRRAPVAPARVPLSQERILDAAAELVGTEGASSFSMRQLAERLGVTPMAIYTWFPNREQLLGALASRTMGEMALPDASTGPWHDRALALAQAIRAHVLAHREAVQLPGASSGLAAAMLAAADRGLGLMLELGYDDAEAVDRYRALFWHVMGYALTVDIGGAAPAGGGAPLGAQYRDVLDALGDDASTLRRLLPVFDVFDPDAFFTRSVALLLAAIEDRSPARAARRVPSAPEADA